MKKELIVLLLLLAAFLLLLSGMVMGRLSNMDGIIISYESGAVYPTDTTNPKEQIAETAPVPSGRGKININTATKSQLTTLQNIGDVLAQRIIDYREEHGPFGSTEDLMNVNGIGQTRFAQIKDDITVGG